MYYCQSKLYIILQLHRAFQLRITTYFVTTNEFSHLPPAECSYSCFRHEKDRVYTAAGHDLPFPGWCKLTVMEGTRMHHSLELREPGLAIQTAAQRRVALAGPWYPALTRDKEKLNCNCLSSRRKCVHSQGVALMKFWSLPAKFVAFSHLWIRSLELCWHESLALQSTFMFRFFLSQLQYMMRPLQILKWYWCLGTCDSGSRFCSSCVAQYKDTMRIYLSLFSVVAGTDMTDYIMVLSWLWSEKFFISVNFSSCRDCFYCGNHLT